MLSEIIKSIVTQYNTLSYDGGDISDTAPIYFGTAKDDADYPFTSFYLVDTSMEFTTCSDLYDTLLQFSVYDNSKSPKNVLLISDVVLEGFNESPLSGLDGSQITLEAVSQRVEERSDESGHVAVLEFKLLIEKQR